MAEKTTNILIVEDEKPMAHALQLKLQHEGFDVDLAANGEEALSLTAKNAYDLVVTDLIMPKMDGFALLVKLKKDNYKTRTIVMSNLSQEEDVKKAKELGAADYFVKSNTSLAEIINRIKALLIT